MRGALNVNLRRILFLGRDVFVFRKVIENRNEPAYLADGDAWFECAGAFGPLGEGALAI